MVFERSHTACYDCQEYSRQALYSGQAFALAQDAADHLRMSLERIRRERELSQEDLAEMAGVKQSTISKIERGNDGVTLRVLKQLAGALKVDVTDLLTDDRTAAETALIRAFRNLPADRQQGWLDLAVALVRDEDKAS